MLGLENSQAFIELRQLFPGHPVWTAEDQWEKNYGEYIEGLSAWCSQIRTTLVDGILDILNFGNEKSRASVEVNLAFVGTVVSCDFLLGEIKERPPSPLWYLEAENLRQVRANAISHSSTAVKKFLSSEYDFDSVWERKIAIPSTGDLLDKLEMLDATSNHLRSALAELELHITPS